MVLLCRFARQHYAEDNLYRAGDWLMFGSETSGLPLEVGMQRWGFYYCWLHEAAY